MNKVQVNEWCSDFELGLKEMWMFVREHNFRNSRIDQWRNIFQGATKYNIKLCYYIRMILV